MTINPITSNLYKSPGAIQNEYISMDYITSYDKPSCKIGALPENRAKNRFEDGLVIDSTRVLLPHRVNDYINANWCLNQTVILSQGPLDDGHADFYHMIWSYDCPVVLMLTDYQENGKSKCSHYLPEEDNTTKVSGEYSIKTLSCTSSLNAFGIKEREVFLSKENQKKTFLHLHVSDWSDYKGTNPEIVATLAQKLLGEKNPSLIHCSAGLGRTGVVATVMSILKQFNEAKPVDVQDTVIALRKERKDCVQSPEQYRTIYEASKILAKTIKEPSSSQNSRVIQDAPIFSLPETILKKICSLLNFQERSQLASSCIDMTYFFRKKICKTSVGKENFYERRQVHDINDQQPQKKTKILG